MAVPETSENPTHIIYNIIQRHRQLLAVILYRYLYLYILYYIIYRAPGVAIGNNHFLLRAAVHSGQQGTEGRERLAGWNADWLLRYITQGVNAIGCHHATATWLLVATRLLKPCERAGPCQGIHPMPFCDKWRLIRISTLTLDGVPSLLV